MSTRRKEIENKMTDTIRWEVPPVQTAGRPHSKKWAAVADALKSNPGEWAVVAENVSPTTAHLIRSGSLKAFAPKGAFEAVTRGNKNNRAESVYARYVGSTVSAL